MSVVRELNTAVNGFVWGVPAMAAIVGVGLWLCVSTRQIQIRRFPAALRTVFGRSSSHVRPGQTKGPSPLAFAGGDGPRIASAYLKKRL